VNVSRAFLNGAHNDFPPRVHIESHDELVARIVGDQRVQIGVHAIPPEQGAIWAIGFNEADAGIADDLPMVV